MSSLATPSNSFRAPRVSTMTGTKPSQLSQQFLPSDGDASSSEAGDFSNIRPNLSSLMQTNPSIMSTRTDLVKPDFYKQEGWFEIACEILFKVQARGSSFRLECYYGFVHFISCLYVMAVIPVQLGRAGYPYKETVVAVGACCSVGCILGGLFTNLPFVVAPPTVISIFFSVYLQSRNMDSNDGNIALMISGAILIIFFFRPLGRLADKLIPLPIQVGTTIGVGLITALAGAIDINVVVTGRFTLLESGDMQSKATIITVVGIVLITSFLFHKVKGAFCVGLVFCSIVYWWSTDTWPTDIASVPKTINFTTGSKPRITSDILVLVIDLVFLYVLYLSGVISAFGSLSGLNRENGTTPRSRWFYIWTGAMCILSGLIGGAPILISPESTAGIKAGAKTGLSTVVCGMCFGLACFFSGLFAAVPAAGTSPLLIMIGVLLMQDVNRLNWKKVEDAAPAFMVLFFIPFTFSIIHGVIIGYIIYVCVGLTSGSLYPRSLRFFVYYFPCLESQLEKHDKKHFLNSITEADVPEYKEFVDKFSQLEKNKSSNNIHDVNSNNTNDDNRGSNNSNSTTSPSSANNQQQPGSDGKLDSSLDFNRKFSKDSYVGGQNSQRTVSNQSSTSTSVMNPINRRVVASHLVSVDRSLDGNIGFIPNLRDSERSIEIDYEEDRDLESTQVIGPDGKNKAGGTKVKTGFIWGSL